MFYFTSNKDVKIVVQRYTVVVVISKLTVSVPYGGQGGIIVW